MIDIENVRVGIIGLGYVGLPLAVEFGKYVPTVGFDVNESRIAELEEGRDTTKECSSSDISGSRQLVFSTELEPLKNCNVYIVTVPTPIDAHKRPDLSPLIGASSMLGGVLKVGDVVVYESTVYPGATEEDCVPVLERISGLKLNADFFVGYSPERINPGDKLRNITNIKKVTSGSTPEAAEFVDVLYSLVVQAGTHKASSIKVAEASKVIENTQRDLNIALVNELAIIFNRLGIDTEEVLDAAGTKWNFLPFKPGLVGGHCIGVDPYYLTHKAQSVGYMPDVIMAGRRINDGMGSYVANELIHSLVVRGADFSNVKVLVLGLTFKENCPDLRNTKVVDVIKSLEYYGVSVEVHDPWVDPKLAKQEYGLDLLGELPSGSFDAVVVAVAHDVFKSDRYSDLRRLCKSNGVICDLKYMVPKNDADIRL